MARSRPITAARYRPPRPDRQHRRDAMSHLHVHGPGDHHGHHHGHADGGRVSEASRDGDNAASVRRLRAALAVTAAFLVVEVVGGWLSNSLALLADAGHMLTDVAALALSLFVAWFAGSRRRRRRRYGYLRWEVLAAFLNGATLLLDLRLDRVRRCCGFAHRKRSRAD